jgi:hypothetical protein
VDSRLEGVGRQSGPDCSEVSPPVFDGVCDGDAASAAPGERFDGRPRWVMFGDASEEEDVEDEEEEDVVFDDAVAIPSREA